MPGDKDPSRPFQQMVIHINFSGFPPMMRHETSTILERADRHRWLVAGGGPLRGRRQAVSGKCRRWRRRESVQSAGFERLIHPTKHRGDLAVSPAVPVQALDPLVVAGRQMVLPDDDRHTVARLQLSTMRRSGRLSSQASGLPLSAASLARPLAVN